MNHNLRQRVAGIGSVILVCLCLAIATTRADVVRTKEGAELIGTITLIDQGRIHLETSYAGLLKIKQDRVETFEFTEPRVLRLKSGSVIAGSVRKPDDLTLRIVSEEGVLETSVSEVAAAWRPDDEDPEIVRNQRRWHGKSSFDLIGRSGGTDSFRVGATLEMDLKSPKDTLSFFFEYEEAEENGNKVDSNIEAGMSYESFFRKVHGWYLRSRFETDPIDDIQLRSTFGTGISYRILNAPHKRLVFRTGVGYRQTTYDSDIENESVTVLDLGLLHRYKYKNHFEMRNSLTAVPTSDDFSNYRLVQDSYVEMPIGREGNWKIRIGIKNEYENVAQEEEELDTGYYTKMVYSWD